MSVFIVLFRFSTTILCRNSKNKLRGWTADTQYWTVDISHKNIRMFGREGREVVNISSLKLKMLVLTMSTGNLLLLLRVKMIEIKSLTR